MLRLLRHFVFIFSLAFVAGLARDARADSATAQALFDQGKKLMTEKKYAEACPKFEESQKLDPGLGTQMNLALCYESMGRTASAWSLYLEVAGSAKSAGQTDREKRARDSAKALEPKLSKLTIEVASPPTGLEVKRNGVLVNQATWGTPIPVDPGDVTVTAMAPDRKEWSETVKIEKPGETKISVPELEKGKTPAGYGAGAGPTATTSSTATGGPPPPPGNLPPPMKRRSKGLMIGGIVMMPIGLLVGLAGVGVMATTDADVGPGLAIAGAVLLGGGIAMTVIGAKKVPAEPASSKLKISPIPEVRVGLGSVAAEWQF